MLKIAACDDEAQVLKQVCAVLDAENQKGGDLRVTAFQSSAALLSKIEDGARFDVYFLDILMPDITGMELASAIRKTDEAAQIVFLTSSPEYAVESYEVEALGYLIKPVSAEKLAAMLAKTRSKISSRKSETILLSQGGRLRAVPISAVVCVESLHNKLTYYLSSGERVACYGTISEAAQTLCADARFIRPHRSYLVNMEHIREFDGKNMVLSEEVPLIPVSRSVYQELKERYIAYMVHMAGGKRIDS